MNTKNSMISFIRLPDVLTMMNGACGLIAIFAAIEQHILVSVILLLSAGLFDLFDGKLARKMGLGSEFGKHLDSLCDLVSFVVAPAVIVYILLRDPSIYEVAILIYHAVSGILGLARFNITGAVNDDKWFEGMPVPFSLIILILFLSSVDVGIDEQIAVLLFFIQSILMTSLLKVRKL